MKPSEAAERAVAFVAQYGDEGARLRAEALLGRVEATRALDAQEPVGPAPEALRRALEAADDLRALQDPRVEAWVSSLARGQAADGGFAADRPLPLRLFETGMIAGHVAKTRYARPETLVGAADFLASHWDPGRVRGGSWRAIAAYAHLFSNVDHEVADAVLQWCGRELARAFLTRAFDAVRTARVLVYCDAHALPGADLRSEELLVALLSEQGADGAFPAWRGEGARDPLGSTLDALVALRRLG